MAFENRDYASGGRFGGSPRGFGGGGFGGGGAGGFVTPEGKSVTTRLILINAGVLLLGAIVGERELGSWFAFNPRDAVFGGQLWTFLTYQFLHGDFGHLLWNMLGLFFLGPLVERSFGARRFLVFYLACGVAGSVLMALVSPFVGASVISPDADLVGASGAVLGVLIAAAIRFPQVEVLVFFLFPVKIRIIAGVALFVGVYTLISGGDNAGGEAAHLGGLALGALLTMKSSWLRYLGGGDVGPGGQGDLGGYGEAKRKGGGIQGIKQRLEDFQRERARKAAVAHAEEVDRILAKVSASGIQSLTDGEKKTLAEDTKRKS